MKNAFVLVILAVVFGLGISQFQFVAIAAPKPQTNLQANQSANKPTTDQQADQQEKQETKTQTDVSKNNESGKTAKLQAGSKDEPQTATFTGTVRDEKGKPIAGAAVLWATEPNDLGTIKTEPIKQ